MDCKICGEKIQTGNQIKLYVKTHLQGIGEITIPMRNETGHQLYSVVCTPCLDVLFKSVRKMNSVVD
jgi:hypothetical protein